MCDTVAPLNFDALFSLKETWKGCSAYSVNAHWLRYCNYNYPRQSARMSDTGSDLGGNQGL